MFRKRRERIRQWHKRLVIIPRRIDVHERGWRWAFLEYAQARWSDRKGRWFWRTLSS